MNKNDCVQCKLKKQSSYQCKPCQIKTCSFDCLNKHNKDHKTPTKLQSIIETLKIKRKSTLETPFAIKGEILKELNPVNLFDLKNFEINKQSKIGSGAYGDVFLSKNKANNVFYAIKQV